jgi:hypothetical protein
VSADEVTGAPTGGGRYAGPGGWGGRRYARRLTPGVASIGLATLALASVASPASAHPLIGRSDAPLPLELYLAGAGLAVALSFVIGFVHEGSRRVAEAPAVRRLPRALVVLLRGVGLLAWGWVVAQAILGGSSDAEVGRLFTWVFGWVGLAIVCALLVPLWDWLDPFAAIHDVGAWVLRRFRIRGWRTVAYPARLGLWPAVAGFAGFVWLELAYRDADMDVVVVAYTAFTLAAMALFGRDRWRENGEVFSVWFGLLGRLARYASAGSPGSGLVRRQRFPDGLIERPWDQSRVTLVAVATGAILYDGLSQTESFFDLFSVPSLAASTLLLAAFLGVVVALAVGVGSRVGLTAIGAGLLPVSVGYLIAHYLTYLLGDGQRIVVALADPFQRGWDLTGTAFYEPSTAWLGDAGVWLVMFGAVVGGHLLGAWAGHFRADDRAAGRARGRRTQVPLALVMVGLTTLTLWSLAQAVFHDVGTCQRQTLAARDPWAWLLEGGAEITPNRLTAEVACE